MENHRKWIIGIGVLILVLGVAVLLWPQAGANLKDENSASEGGRASPEAPAAAKAKRKSSEQATRAALTKATDYRPAATNPGACSIEYETLAMLATDEIKNRIVLEEASLTEACRQELGSDAGLLALEEIRKACMKDISGPECKTLVIKLRSKLMEIVTRDADPASLPANIILNKIYTRSISNHGPADIMKTLDPITELESRDEHLGFEQQRLSLMSKLVDQDKNYQDEFEELAEKLEASLPEDVLPYRFKNSLINQDWSAAEAIVKDHVQRHPQSAQAYYLLSIVEFKRGHVERALELANQSLQMDPSNVAIRDEVQNFRDDPENWQGYYRLPSVTYSF